MLCDKDQQFSCPDTVCKNSDIRFSVCEYIFTDEPSTDVTFNGCADTSKLDCFAPELASCLFLRNFVNVYGVNTTEPAGNQTVPCENLSDSPTTPLIPSSGTNATLSPDNVTATLDSLSPTASESAANVNQAAFTTLILAFICLLTISLSRKF